ncbi:MAG: hypothetical protein ACKVOK_09140 [Flavobacteriales bacterium]
MRVLLLVLFAFNSISAISADRKKVAVVTFYCDKWIDMSDLGGTAALMSAAGTLAEDTTFDIKKVLTNFHDVFFNEFSKQLPFDLIPESEVIGNEDYKAFQSYWDETSDKDQNKLMQRYATVDGYKPLLEMLSKSEKRNENRMLEIFGDKVDGVMFVYLDFSMVQKIAVGGTGAAGVSSYCRMKLWNKEGKKVFAINEHAMSKGTVAVVGGIPIMKPEKILPLCEDSSERLLEDLRKRLGKIVSKSADKL